MTTPPVPSITDDIMAEIEAEFRACHANHRDIIIEPEQAVALVGRLRDAERWQAEAVKVLYPVLDYAHSLGIAKPGQSVSRVLIDDHKRLRETERDAARYRYWRDTACQSPVRIAHALTGCLHPDDVDTAIDAAMKASQCA